MLPNIQISSTYQQRLIHKAIGESCPEKENGADFIGLFLLLPFSSSWTRNTMKKIL